MFKSKCCNTDVKFIMSPDFVGDDPKKMRVGTCSFVCEKCGKPCDADVVDSQFVVKNDWTLMITRHDNGYLLQGEQGELGWVIEDNEMDVLKSHESLLQEVMNYFDFGGSKHDKVRLRVTRVKQKG